ncbi:hypothetical protein FQN60_000602 [Etheostoma spectabile]|uniref:Arrestin-C n=1 Tax=Etheostoma spectabile TaxID=54343 RepID=A0A5J5D235_9PERO|nr:hypothetical protein FQN60_000602 [Etheostoma spectabile]
MITLAAAKNSSKDLPEMAKVFKKTSRNGGLSLYLGKRDYVDSLTSVEKVEGVVLLDPSSLGDKKVFVQLACAFRYGNEDLDAVGLCFRKDIWIHHLQIYPDYKCSSLSLKIPTNLPCSVSLQPGPDDKGKACGVDFEVKAYLAMEKNNPDEKIEKNSPRHSQNPLYFHGEVIPIKIKINNESNKTVKKFKITVEQTTDIVLYSADKYSKNVLNAEFGETVEAESTYNNTLNITPMLAENKEKRGLALDGQLKEEDTNLASTTVLGPGAEKEVMGILVSYKIKITLMVAGGGLLGGLTASDVSVELPLKLMHPKPEERMLHLGLKRNPQNDRKTMRGGDTRVKRRRMCLV